MTDHDKYIIEGKSTFTVQGSETYLGSYKFTDDGGMERVTIKNTMPNELYVQLNSYMLDNEDLIALGCFDLEALRGVFKSMIGRYPVKKEDKE